MKTLILFFLLAAALFELAQSLQCYTCAAATSNSNCNTVTNCTSLDTYCMTTVQSTSVGSIISATIITKVCAAACTPSSQNIVVINKAVTCCKTDLCNINGAPSAKTSYMVLAATMGFIGVLLRAGL